MLYAIGNDLLTDVGHILDIQQSSDNGTYIANNPVLCFDAAVEWARHSQSYLESNLTLVSFSALNVVLLLIIDFNGDLILGNI